ncbi:hypothetical protein M3J09_012055 [Ascochyta lentis]
MLKEVSPVATLPFANIITSAVPASTFSSPVVHVPLPAETFSLVLMYLSHRHLEHQLLHFIDLTRLCSMIFGSIRQALDAYHMKHM